MIVREIIERLSGPGTPFAIVEGANALAEVTERPPTVPAAYVYSATDASGPNERMTGRVLQRTEADIAVVIVTENQGSNLDVATDIETLKRWVRGRLIGFLPTDAEQPIEHVAGQIQQAKDRMVWFEDVFATAYYQEGQE
jgi:hypothetical protein